MISNDQYGFSLSLELLIEPGRLEVLDSLISFSSVFALNSIPSARVSVPSGRDALTDEPAPIHAILKDLTKQMPAAVWLTQTVGDPEVTSRFLIFEGIFTGVGWARSSKAAQYEITLTHWLQHLNSGSAISATTSSMSIYNLSQQAINGQGADTTSAGGWVNAVSKALINESSMFDIWGKTLYPWLIDLSSRDPIDAAMQIRGISNISANVIGRSNLILALNKLAPRPAQPELAIKAGGVNRAAVSHGVRAALTLTESNGFTHTTVWGKLVGEIITDFSLEIVPRIGDALVVPATGGLREPFVTISPDEYSQANLNAGIVQPLQAVSLMAPSVSQTRGTAKQPRRVDTSGSHGLYKPVNADGIVLVKQPPSWLGFAVGYSLLQDERASPVLSTPQDAVEDGPDAEDAKRVEQETLIKLLRGPASLVAHQLYVSEVLKDRVGSLVGRLRFDIAPGSSILILPPDNDADESGQSMYAKVMAVSQFIDATSAVAATSFSLSHARSPAENKLDGNAVDQSPLYETTWYGANMGVEDATANATP